MDPLFELKFPIGKFNAPDEITSAHIDEWISQIESLPKRLTHLVKNISEEQLDTPYRPDGWTVRQVIHHIPDSHINSYMRFKWALTEDNPTIKAYIETAWAELPDTKDQPIQISLHLLTAVHAKLVALFRSMSPEQMKRTFVHPATGKKVTLEKNIGSYAWHGNHHLAHVALILNH
ncbi:MAG: putative metal-dependent hydrolase [Cyclobacteriaceae bacterium]|nr:putative metal-dependent hydrolase [Cyclobacteriaceae bacterium]